MAVTVLTQDSFNETVSKSAVPVLVDFYADWCMPCKMVAPLLEEISKEQAGKALVCKINIDYNREVAEQFNVMSIPFLMSFKNGKPYKNVVGAVPKDELLALLS